MFYLISIVTSIIFGAVHKYLQFNNHQSSDINLKTMNEIFRLLQNSNLY